MSYKVWSKLGKFRQKCHFLQKCDLFNLCDLSNFGAFNVNIEDFIGKNSEKMTTNDPSFSYQISCLDPF